MRFRFPPIFKNILRIIFRLKTCCQFCFFFFANNGEILILKRHKRKKPSNLRNIKSYLNEKICLISLNNYFKLKIDFFTLFALSFFEPFKDHQGGGLFLPAGHN